MKKIPANLIIRPFQSFVRSESASSVLLLICALLALGWANSPWADSYFGLWNAKLTVDAGGYGLSKPLLLWINDGLMAIFFLLVGLEIKREILVGELSSPQHAALPAVAAIGGMLLPAIFFLALNLGTEGAGGWGVPVATDIAFALGVLTLLGNRVPLGLKVFVTALAIVDDIGAVLIIALFYTAKVSVGSLLIGAFFLVALMVANRLGVRRPLVYALLGIGLWVAFLKSGIHATVAGVLLAITIPARTLIDTKAFTSQAQAIVGELEQIEERGPRAGEKGAAVQSLEALCEKVESPLQRFEHTLQPWIAFAVMPLFALANAGVSITGDFLSVLFHPISLGVILGLVIGKLTGITLFSWIAVRTRIARMPEGVTWRHIFGASWLCGIGFTMSLFIAGLAFASTSGLNIAKVGILTASLIAGVIGYFLLKRFGAVRPGLEA